MRRLLVSFWTIAILLSGMGLYQLKYAVEHLESELLTTEKSIIKQEDINRTLEAEWIYLNNPERLTELNETFTKLSPIMPEQMMPLTEEQNLVNHVSVPNTATQAAPTLIHMREVP